ncbi:hypothetical protein ACJMK2_007629 [Sinanodonta woodiana]|uniref:Uncharacterized protein n=1 Tax=Sinanodonta woodiana TaxID=1069815 RepID=A0ABD3VJ37_SINWO
MPHINPQETSFLSLVYELQRNNLTSIPSAAFMGLQIGFSLSLILSDNRISHIADDAFHGIENVLQFLTLDNNQLTTVPTALLSLTGLSSLWISRNPITVHGFDYATLLHIGRTLTLFGFGSPELQAWPTHIRHLEKLNTLEISNISASILPLDAFRGFEHRLEYLELFYTPMVYLPPAICHLTALKTLHLFHTNIMAQDDTILEACATHHSSVQNLIIVGDSGLKRFPKLPESFPNLESVRVSEIQDLYYLTNDEISTHAKNLHSIKVETCSLQHVPSALRKLSSMRTLSLSNNQILTIESNDFNEFPPISDLDFSGNPLSYVSSKAFQNLKWLVTLTLSNTELTAIPSALASIIALDHLFLENTKIKCGCDMSWMLNLREIRFIHIVGKCYGKDQTIADYIHNDLPRCNATIHP